jgi:hypothetical protein
MQQVDYSNIANHLTTQKRKAYRKSATRNVKEEIVQFVLCNEQGTKDDLKREFTDAELLEHFDAAHDEARKRMRHQRAA